MIKTFREVWKYRKENPFSYPLIFCSLASFIFMLFVLINFLFY